MKNIFLLIIFTVFSFSYANAEIAFTDGVWETTFDCTEVIQPSNPDCDGIIGWGGGWSFNQYVLTDGVANNWLPSVTSNEWYYNANTFDTFSLLLSKNLFVGQVGGTKYDDLKPGPPYGVYYLPGELVAETWAVGDGDTIGFDTVYVYSTTDPDLEAGGQIRVNWNHEPTPEVGDYLSSVTSGANNPDGLGGNGFRTWDGDGSGSDTSPLQINLPEPLKELWFRWYMKHEKLYEWYPLAAYGGDRIPLQQKHVYIYTVPTGTEVVAQFVDYEYSLTAQNVPTPFPVKTTGEEGWTAIMGVPASGGGADGLWHCYELHIKMNSATGVADGEGHIWLDGVLKKTNLAVDWSGTRPDALPGWTNFKLGENQSAVDNSGEVRSVEFDDLVVSKVGYIGPVAPPTTTAILKRASLKRAIIK